MKNKKEDVCMKKLLCILLLVCMTATAAAESVDLSGLSYADLVALKDRINLAIWNSQEWQEVTVPQGVWIVGEDIPAGTWDVKCATDKYADVYYGNELREDGVSVKINQRFYHEIVVSTDYRRYEPGKDRDVLTIEIREGDYVVIEDSSVIFMPTAGKPDLGFK